MRPPPPRRPSSWQADIGQRLRRMFLLKLLGVSAFTWLFFIGYFQLLRFPLHSVTVMPLTALDRWIPFQPTMMPFYLSLWVYVGIAPGLQLRLRELLVYGAWIAAMCLTGLACFYAWPTAVPRVTLPVSDFPGFATLRGVDAAGNACPSMHVAVALFSALWIDHLLRLATAPRSWRLLNAAWFVLIGWSTLAVKQHVVLDVLAGALLGAVFAWLSLRWNGDAGRVATAPIVIMRGR